MPIALDPSETYEVVLESDKGKDPAPAFVFHHLTRRQLRQWDKVIEQLKVTDDETEAERLFDEIIALGIVGWRNMKDRDGKDVPYSGSVDDVLMVAEKRELALAYVPAGMELESKKKQSPSPSPSATGNSAAAADPPPAA